MSRAVSRGTSDDRLQVFGRPLALFTLKKLGINLDESLVRRDLEERLSLLHDRSVTAIHDDLVNCTGERRPDRIEHLHDFDDVEGLVLFKMHPLVHK